MPVLKSTQARLLILAPIINFKNEKKVIEKIRKAHTSNAEIKVNINICIQRNGSIIPNCYYIYSFCKVNEYKKREISKRPVLLVAFLKANTLKSEDGTS